MNINFTNSKLFSQYNLVSQLFGAKGKSANAFGIASKGSTDMVEVAPGFFCKNDPTIIANFKKNFDKNGRPLNSAGESGFYIDDFKEYKKIVSVSDDVKADLAEIIKQDFISTNGRGIPEGSKRNDIINKYIRTISSPDTRASACWTLQRMAGDYATRLEKLVRQSNPNWKPGDAFDTSILDQLDGTLGGVDFKA